jgi:hypothetical protein
MPHYGLIITEVTATRYYLVVEADNEEMAQWIGESRVSWDRDVPFKELAWNELHTNVESIELLPSNRKLSPRINQLQRLEE